MLLNEEKSIMQWLSDYGPLPEELIISLIHYREASVVKQIIYGLVRSCYITERHDGLLGVDRLQPADDRNITALWVLAEFIRDIKPGEHRSAKLPCQVYFLKRDIGYRIIVLKENESRKLEMIQTDDDMKYIIVAPDPKAIDMRFLPEMPCVIATVTYSTGDKPEVRFYGGSV